MSKSKPKPITVTAQSGVTAAETPLVDTPREPVCYLPGSEPDRNTATVDGFVVDLDTGEVLGFAIIPLGKEEFDVTDVESAEWVLRKMLEAKAAIEAVHQTADVILARNILAAAEGLTKPHANKLKWLTERFGSQIKDVAKANLPAKGKTWRSLYGHVAFRLVKAQLEVVAESRAAKWLAANAPKSIRVVADLDALTEKDRLFISSLVAEDTDGVQVEILKSKFSSDLLVRAANTPDFEAVSGIAYKPERESATITVGEED